MADREIRLEDPATWPASAREYYRRWLRDHQGRPELERLVRERIRERGRIPFAEFMALALYHPEHGYYRTNPERMTSRGDYLTSPETHPAFGYLIGRWLWDAWRQMGSPAAWRVIEAGAGTGRLAAQIHAAARRDAVYAAALRYGIIEPDPAARAAQRRTLGEYSEAVSWHDTVADAAGAPMPGCVLTNEFFDALPVHRVVRVGRTLKELWVVEREGIPAEEPGPLSRPALRHYFRPYRFLPPEGVRVEVNLAAPRWLQDAAHCLERGYVLTLDYGGRAEELYRLPSATGTLRAYHRHTLCPDPFRRIGEQDLTADVDFTALMLAGEAAGLVTKEYTTQAAFLSRLAWEEWRSGNGENFPDGATRSRGLLELVDPAHLGDIRVLVQEKGV